MGILERSATTRLTRLGGICFLLLGGALATSCNRPVDGDVWVLRHAPTVVDTGWARLDASTSERLRTLLQRASNHDLQAPDPAAATAVRRVRLRHNDTLVWAGAYLPPNCVVSDTDSYCVARDDSDAVTFLREVFR
jgi:hypothetical protein